MTDQSVALPLATACTAVHEVNAHEVAKAWRRNGGARSMYVSLSIHKSSMTSIAWVLSNVVESHVCRKSMLPSEANSACRPLRRLIAAFKLTEAKGVQEPVLGPITDNDLTAALQATKPSALLHQAKFNQFTEEYGLAA